MTAGDAAFEPHSRRPKSIRNRTSDRVRERVIALRNDLTAQGMDAGADTNGPQLAREHIRVADHDLTHPPANSSQNSHSTPKKTTNAKRLNPRFPRVQSFTMPWI